MRNEMDGGMGGGGRRGRGQGNRWGNR